MYITLDLMAAFVRCRYKAFLKCTGEPELPPNTIFSTGS